MTHNALSVLENMILNRCVFHIEINEYAFSLNAMFNNK